MNVLVIGGGPAGMLAAATAGENGHRVTLLEQNEKLGKKLYITGKGRCNLTNLCSLSELLENVPENPKFLYRAFTSFPPEAVIALFESLGVPLKVERGRRVFPQSDKSSDILKALEGYVRLNGVRVMRNTRVSSLLSDNGHVTGALLADGTSVLAERVILCTGGVSYPSTGSVGDGYGFLSALGHTIYPPVPALVPLETEEAWPGTLSGLTLKNITLRAYQGTKRVYEELGELLFAHFGVTGPLVLSVSSRIAHAPEGTRLMIDLKPGLTNEQLDQRLLRDIEAGRQRSVKNALFGLLPERLLPVVLNEAGIDPFGPAGGLTKGERLRLGGALKGLPLTVAKARPLSEAIITRGGVSTKEVRPNTLESKLIAGLYLAGEVLDVDGYTGGYNLQIAWSTGKLAGLLQ